MSIYRLDDLVLRERKPLDGTPAKTWPTITKTLTILSEENKILNDNGKTPQEIEAEKRELYKQKYNEEHVQNQTDNENSVRGMYFNTWMGGEESPESFRSPSSATSLSEYKTTKHGQKPNSSIIPGIGLVPTMEDIWHTSEDTHTQPVNVTVEIKGRNSSKWAKFTWYVDPAKVNETISVHFISIKITDEFNDVQGEGNTYNDIKLTTEDPDDDTGVGQSYDGDVVEDFMEEKLRVSDD